MKEMKKITAKHLIISSLIIGINIVLASFQVVFSSFVFVRLINVVTIIILSVIVGAFIREIFLLKKK